MVSVDKFTAVKMFDKVQRLWKEELKALHKRIAEMGNEVEKARLKQIVKTMHSVEMAVVISEDTDEETKFAELLDESVVVNDAEACKARQYNAEYQIIQSAVEEVLNTNLPESYDRVLFKEKCDNVFYLMLDYASHGRKWAA